MFSICFLFIITYLKIFVEFIYVKELQPNYKFELNLL